MADSDPHRVRTEPLESREDAEGVAAVIEEYAPIVGEILEVVPVADEEEREFETADLREGETRDDDAHARRNAEQLRMAEEEVGDG
ncbi:MAG: hypothetical protein ABEI57_07265 [Halapricum sp.]